MSRCWVILLLYRSRSPLHSDLTRTLPWAYSADNGGYMDKNISLLVFVLIMAVIIVAVDFVLFRQHFWARLIANIGIVLIFVALYLRFLR